MIPPIATIGCDVNATAQKNVHNELSLRLDRTIISLLGQLPRRNGLCIYGVAKPVGAPQIGPARGYDEWSIYRNRHGGTPANAAGGLGPCRCLS
jgi:hypothetical protein